MLQNTCKTLSFKKNMVYKIPPGGGKPYPASGLKCLHPSDLNFKVRKAANIKNRYNQVPHLTQDIIWESDRTQLNITNKSQEVSPFSTGEILTRHNYLKLSVKKYHSVGV